DTFRAVFTDCESDSDVLGMMLCLISQGCALSYRGDVGAARKVGRAAMTAGAELDVVLELASATVMALAAAVDDDVATAGELSTKIWEHPGVHRGSVAASAVALCAHAYGDLTRANEVADEAVATLAGWHKMW